MTPISALGDLLAPNLVDRPVNPLYGLFTLDVELRFADRPPLRLWSQLQPVYRESEYSEFAVLDLLVVPDRVVVAMVYPGSSILLWEIQLRGPARLTALPAAWSLLAASIPAPPGRLSAKLAYDDAQNRIQVEVTDSLEGDRQRTLFQQKAEQWEFVRVKQWQEKLEARQGKP